MNKIEKPNKNNTTNPEYYKKENGLEVIDIIDSFTEGLSGVEAFDTGNVIKYICRWNKKGGLDDLEKAAWYLRHLINHVSKKESFIK